MFVVDLERHSDGEDGLFGPFDSREEAVKFVDSVKSDFVRRYATIRPVRAIFEGHQSRIIEVCGPYESTEHFADEIELCEPLAGACKCSCHRKMPGSVVVHAVACCSIVAPSELTDNIDGETGRYRCCGTNAFSGKPFHAWNCPNA